MSDSKKEEDECQNWKDSRGFYIESVNGSEISWKFNKRGHFVRQDVENQFSNINLSQYKPNTLNIKGEKETLDNSHESDSRTNAHKCAFTLQEYFDYKLNNNNKVKVKNRRKIPQPKMKPPKEYLLDESDMVEFSNITETETSDDSSESDCTETEENLTDSRKVGIPEHETDTNQEYLLDESGLLKIPNITESGTLGNLQESDSTETEENLTDSREGLRIPEHETDTNPENLLEVESDLAKLPNITQRNTLDNSHESYCISGKIFSQRDESNQISKEEFLNNLVREDEGICQVEGYNVETNEAIQGILQSSKENYQYKKNEKEIYTKGCVEDTEDVSNVGKEEQDLYLITEGKETGEKPAEETDKMEIDEKHVKENYLQENLPVVIEVVEGKQKIYSILYKSPWEIAYLHDQEINISKVLCVKLSKNCGKKKLQHFKAFILAQKDGQEEVYNILDSKKQEKISAHKANEAKIKKNKKSKKKNMLWIMKKLFVSSENKNKLKIKRLPSIKEQLGIGNLVDYFIEEQISKLCSDSHRAGKFEYIYKQEYKPGDEDEMISMKNPKAKKNIVCVWHVIKGKKKCDFLLEPNSTYMKHFVRGTGSLTRQCNVSNPQKELVLPERDKVGPLKKPKKLSVLEQVLKDLKEKKLLEKHGISVDVFSEEKGSNPNHKKNASSPSKNSEGRKIVVKNKEESIEKMHKKKEPKKGKKPSGINVKVTTERENTVSLHNCKNMKRRSLLSRDKNVKNKNNKLKVASKHEKKLKKRKRESTNSDNSSNQNLSQMHKLKLIINKVMKKKRKLLQKKQISNNQKQYKIIFINENIMKIKLLGSGQPSEQPKTAIKHQEKRNANEEAAEREAINEISIGQQSEQPMTTIKHPKKRKANEEATEREAINEISIGQQSEQPKTTKGRKKSKPVGEAKESALHDPCLRMTERQLKNWQQKKL